MWHWAGFEELGLKIWIDMKLGCNPLISSRFILENSSMFIKYVPVGRLVWFAHGLIDVVASSLA